MLAYLIVLNKFHILCLTLSIVNRYRLHGCPAIHGYACAPVFHRIEGAHLCIYPNGDQRRSRSFVGAHPERKTPPEKINEPGCASSSTEGSCISRGGGTMFERDNASRNFATSQGLYCRTGVF